MGVLTSFTGASAHGDRARGSMVVTMYGEELRKYVTRRVRAPSSTETMVDSMMSVVFVLLLRIIHYYRRIADANIFGSW